MRALALSLGLICAAATSAAQEFTTLKGHGGPIMDVAVNPVTGQVATASFDNSIGLWQGRTPVWLEGHEAAANAVAFLDAGRVVSSGDDFDLILWDIASGGQTRFEGHKGKVQGIAISPDGTWIASASWDGRVGLWPVDGGAPRFLEGHDAGVNDVIFSADGALVYSASADGTIREWDMADGSMRIVVGHGFGVNRLVLGPGGAWLAYGAVDGVTRVIDAGTGATIADFTLERRPILSLAHHAGSNQLAVGDGHGFIMVIDTAAWRITRDFRAMRQGPVWALAFGPDGEIIHAGGLEDVVFAWPVALLDEYDAAGGEPRSFLREADAMPNGERQFMRKCSICHALTPPPSRKAGPTLYGVFGRRAGTVPGYRYSDTLTGSDIIWSDATIDALFDEGPDHYIPGSKMPMQRITQAGDRRDLVEFLRGAAGNGED